VNLDGRADNAFRNAVQSLSFSHQSINSLGEPKDRFTTESTETTEESAASRSTGIEVVCPRLVDARFSLCLPSVLSVVNPLFGPALLAERTIAPQRAQRPQRRRTAARAVEIEDVWSRLVDARFSLCLPSVLSVPSVVNPLFGRSLLAARTSSPQRHRDHGDKYFCSRGWGVLFIGFLIHNFYLRRWALLQSKFGPLLHVPAPAPFRSANG